MTIVYCEGIFQTHPYKKNIYRVFSIQVFVKLLLSIKYRTLWWFNLEKSIQSECYIMFWDICDIEFHVLYYSIRNKKPLTRRTTHWLNKSVATMKNVKPHDTGSNLTRCSLAIIRIAYWWICDPNTKPSSRDICQL